VTVAELLAEAARELHGAGVEAAAWDAERLLRHVLGWDRARVVSARLDEVPAPQASRFRALLARRAQRVPLQHLIGTQEFWRHEFHVTPDVLIPRPDTELLIEQALQLLEGMARPVIVDVGTGSGCVALSLAAERPGAIVHATDLSAPALAVARANAERLGLAARVAFHLGDLLTPVASLRGRVDLVVSNPPYVDRDEHAGLAPEVRDHEPRLALVPPGDALSVYRRLVPAAFEWLRPEGGLAVEIAPALRHSVEALFEGAGFVDVRAAADLGGRDRTLRGRRASQAGTRVG
jgi:release factor glutamine methyltransferase